VNALKGVFFKRRKTDGAPSAIAALYGRCTVNAFINPRSKPVLGLDEP
jgi:hypothetical protein